jgi:hypothetical protein
VELVKEIHWARDVMEFCGHPQRRATYVGEDNQAMITLASKEAGTHGRTKHFTGRINYLIDNVKNGIIRLEYLRTDAQHADGLTKPFGPKAMKNFQQQMAARDSDARNYCKEGPQHMVEHLGKRQVRNEEAQSDICRGHKRKVRHMSDNESADNFWGSAIRVRSQRVPRRVRRM